jgi:hypothetical protein
MDKELKRIDLVLENCEIISVDGEYIYQIQSGKIYSAFHCQNTTAWLSYFTDYLSLKLVKDDKTFYYSNEAVRGEQTAFGRLKLRDITHIDFIYVDGTNLYLGVPWKGLSNFNNKCEKWKENEDFYTIVWDKTFQLPHKILMQKYKIYNFFQKIERNRFLKKEYKKLEEDAGRKNCINAAEVVKNN